MTDGITNLIGPLNGIELVVATGQARNHKSESQNLLRILPLNSRSENILTKG